MFHQDICEDISQADLEVQPTQERKERNISPNLARFASLREVFFFESAISIQPTFSNTFG
jgi:hypothetical protein